MRLVHCCQVWLLLLLSRLLESLVLSRLLLSLKVLSRHVLRGPTLEFWFVLPQTAGQREFVFSAWQPCKSGGSTSSNGPHRRGSSSCCVYVSFKVFLERDRLDCFLILVLLLRTRAFHVSKAAFVVVVLIVFGNKFCIRRPLLCLFLHTYLHKAWNLHQINTETPTTRFKILSRSCDEYFMSFPLLLKMINATSQSQSTESSYVESVAAQARANLSRTKTYHSLLKQTALPLRERHLTASLVADLLYFNTFTPHVALRFAR